MPKPVYRLVIRAPAATLESLPVVADATTIPANTALVAYLSGGPQRMTLLRTAALLTANGYAVTAPAGSGSTGTSTGTGGGSTPIPAAPIITGIAFVQRGTVRTGAAVGTVLGALSVSATGASLINLTFAVVTNNAVRIVNDQAQINAAGVLEGPLTFRVRADADNADPIERDVTVTISPAAAAGTLAPPTYPLLTTPLAVQIGNPRDAAITGARVRTTVQFGRGEMPPGYRAVLCSPDGATEYPTWQLSEATRPSDGSMEKIELIATVPDAFAAYGQPGFSRSYGVKAKAGAPDRTCPVTLDQVKARGAEVRFISVDGVTRWRINVAEVMNAVPAGPPVRNSNPRMRWKTYATSPLGREEHIEAYFSTNGTAAGTSKWLKGRLYQTTYTDGSLDFDFRPMHSNAHGALEGAGIGSVDYPESIDGWYELWVDGSRRHSWGGPDDYRARNVSVITGNGNDRITLGDNHPYGYEPMEEWRNGFDDVARPKFGPPFRVSSTGTLPGTLNAGQTYFPLFHSGQAHTEAALCPFGKIFPEFSKFVAEPWQPNQFVNQGDRRTIDGLHAEAKNGGTTGGSLPAGTQDIQDGQVVWFIHNVRIRGGSGQLRIYPIVQILVHGSQVCGDNDCSPVRIGSSSPEMMFGQDFEHLTTRCWIVPPFEPLNLPPETFTPRAYSLCSPWIRGVRDINDYGDNPGDWRIGWAQNTGTWHIYNPMDRNIWRRTRLEAASFADYPHTYHDQRSMGTIVGNKGPNDDNTPFPGLPDCNDRFAIHFAVSPGNPGWHGGAKDKVSVFYSHRYSMPTDGSHMPHSPSMAYRTTGRPIFLDQLVDLANSTIMADPDGRHHVFEGGRSWSRVLTNNFENAGQPRTVAWALKGTYLAELLLPDSSPEKALFKKYNDDNADYAAAKAVFSDYPQAFKNAGLWGVAGDYAQYWMVYMCGITFGMMAGRGENPSCRKFIDEYLSTMLLSLYDPEKGGCMFWAGCNGNEVSGGGGPNGVKWHAPTTGDARAAAYQTPTDLLRGWQGDEAATRCPLGIANQGAWRDLNSTNAFNGGGWPFTSTDYTTIYRQMLATWAQAGILRAKRLYDDLDARILALSGGVGIQFGKANSSYYSDSKNGVFPTFTGRPRDIRWGQ